MSRTSWRYGPNESQNAETVGRAYWLGAKSSVIYSLIETAKGNHLDPYRYLLWVLRDTPVLSQADAAWAEQFTPANAPDEWASRKKLWEISCNCEKAAMRYDRKLWKNCARNMNKANNRKWENVYKFRGKWAEAVHRELECQEKIKEIKQKKKEAKVRLRQAKRDVKSESYKHITRNR